MYFVCWKSETPKLAKSMKAVKAVDEHVSEVDGCHCPFHLLFKKDKKADDECEWFFF